MLSQGISTNQLADSTGMRREYVSSILNGRVVSQPAIQKISDFLNIACNAL
nr:MULTISPECIES: helix-turn-helix transcriptional regulator [Lachnospiraceae]